LVALGDRRDPQEHQRAVRYRQFAPAEPDRAIADLLLKLADEADRDVLCTSDWVRSNSPDGPAINQLCVPKTKSERIDDEARPRWRAKLWRRIAEPDERPAHPFAKTDAF